MGGKGLYGFVKGNPVGEWDFLGMVKWAPKKVYGSDYNKHFKAGSWDKFYHTGIAIAKDDALTVSSFVYGVAFYLLWADPGTADVEVVIKIICDDDGNIDIDPKNRSSTTDLPSRSIVSWAEVKDNYKLSITAIASGSMNASGGPTIGYRGIIEVSWPEASFENTFQLGLFKWECKCLTEE